jgi:hypothetical protein
MNSVPWDILYYRFHCWFSQPVYEHGLVNSSVEM